MFAWLKRGLHKEMLRMEMIMVGDGEGEEDSEIQEQNWNLPPVSR